VLDPDTGKPMGSSEERLGLIQVTDVQTSFSKAREISGFVTPAEVRNIARPATDVDRSAYAPEKKKKNRHGGEDR
jgi:hypothetical protein